MRSFLKSRQQTLSLQRPLVMGILNVTPDSFSDGGKFQNNEQAAKYAMEMIKQGADIIDIGGESTGPGSKDVSDEEELQRVLPVVKALKNVITNYKLQITNEQKKAKNPSDATPQVVANRCGVRISVDTYKAEVARAVLDAGAHMINDVTALRGDPKMAKALAEYDVPVVLMYSKDKTPRTTREAVHYDDVIGSVKTFFDERITFAIQAGIARERLILDPGMGAFVSADPKYSLQILKRLDEFLDFQLQLLVGPSRKSFIGQVLDVPLNQRLEGTLAACAVAVMNGASILRVHDVQETRRTVDMVHAIITS